MNIRAIETRYKSRRFRSRLEARYAVLFDHLGLQWDYEPEGYTLPGGLRYLPDFFIRCPAGRDMSRRWPGAGYWVEIKPEAPTTVEVRKLGLLAQETGHKGYFFIGQPGEGSHYYVDPGGAVARRVALPLFWSAPLVNCGPADVAGRWDAAVTAALGARFEFGETGGAS